MDSPEDTPPPRDLLRHAQWIRALAGALVGDDAAADDVVQETWVAALSHAPAEPRLRPWLRQVVRNFARQHHRSSARRRAREEAATGPSGLPGPEEVLDRLELEQRLTRELRGLDEPFRSTLVHRYYDNLPPAEIAARLGLPGGTVRWRLKRGLELLRARLDDVHGGDRAAWCLPLLPLARSETTAVLSAGVASVALPGLILMNALKVLGVAAAVLVLAVGLAVTGALPESLVPWTQSEAAVPVGFKPIEPEAGPVEVAALQEPEPRPARVEAATAAAPAPDPEPAAAPPAQWTLDAYVLAGGAPLAGARVVAVVRDGTRQEPVATGRDGYALLAVPGSDDGVAVSVEFHAPGLASIAVESLARPGVTTHLGHIDLEPGGVVSGRVVDESGRGLAGCTLALVEPGTPRRQLERMRFMPPAVGVPSARTDERGQFRLAGAPVGNVRLWGHAPGRVSNFTPPIEVRAGQESFGVELALAPLGPENLVRGTVVDPGGTAVPHAALRYRHSSERSGTTYAGDRETDAEGRFEFLLTEDAHLSLMASDPAGRWGPASVADVTPGRVDLVLRLVEERLVDLVVQGAGGAPVTRYSAEVLDEGGQQRLSGLPDADRPGGRARLPLASTAFLVRISAPGHDLLELGPLDPAFVGDRIEAVLTPLPGLRGVVLRDDEPVGAGVLVALHAAVGPNETVHRNGFRMRMRGEAVDQVRTEADGRFLLTPRAQGSYFVRAEPEHGAPAEYGPFEVGRDLGAPDVELHLGSGGAIEGRVVLAGGVSPEGAIVGLSRGDADARTLRVGADGAYRFEGLMVGPWRLELRDEELQPGRTSTSISSGQRAEPFEDWSCTVFEGETTYFDLREVPAEHWAFTGRLTIDGDGAREWTALLVPSGTFDDEGGPKATLDERGEFLLQATRPGRQRLLLRGLLGDVGEQYLVDEVDVGAGEWRRDLRTGTLVLEGLTSWDGQGIPAVAVYWKGPGDLFCLTANGPDENGAARMEHVPAGDLRLVQPSRSFDPEQWTVLREVHLEAGTELLVDLR